MDDLESVKSLSATSVTSRSEFTTGALVWLALHSQDNVLRVIRAWGSDPEGGTAGHTLFDYVLCELVRIRDA